MLMEESMADNPKKRGRDRELVSEQEHEVAYVMRTARVTRQKALEAIREAGPNRDKVMDYLQSK
ncbi:DUF3606 domain-containing protein [Sinorhizobium meliloti]|jgi:hypothetical protein|nr:DUF3606 domain-containing protein [Sinorhizobium meliloti]ASQ07936.1 DUF3606 domain-containing protein [Sinorhizobium meliloti]MDW9354803.1 DUF3606 domain-containing protein [Sinorhizobium meliloti]MDW9367727.1 DUF3606 domain-containing protein [Sinorhizobium meliloti]MDW9373933.1 DUF3606 domain-containing protein [Sinorhizobium meliloti]